MQILVRTEIQDVFEEIGQPVAKHILSLFENAHFEDYPTVSFSLDNCSVVDINDYDVLDYLRAKQIDTDNILLVSTLFASGFVNTMRCYSNKLAELITEK
jgi:ABC-type metal ion transport system substrate-binding protein